jgi:hypothetical protein
MQMAWFLLQKAEDEEFVWVNLMPSAKAAPNENAQKVSLDELLGGFLLAVSRLPLHSRVQF